MYNKLSSNYNKRRIFNYEGEPPEKKLVTDGDIFIKQLAEKQRSTTVNLQDELSSKNRFYKSTEEVSVTSYTSGPNTLEKFNNVIKHSSDVEKLKSCGLTNEEIELYFAHQIGGEHLKSKHRVINEAILQEQLKYIDSKIQHSMMDNECQVVNSNRLDRELVISAKPSSTETKLLKFALESKQLKEKLPGPMDHIKDVEHQLMKALTPPDIKKIRRKARSLTNQINAINNFVIPEPKVKLCNSEPTALMTSSKWDVKQPVTQTADVKPFKKNIYTCKPHNYYTIKDGKIVKLNQSKEEEIGKKLGLDEIIKMPKFQNYEKGIPSKTLYVKNLANGVEEVNLLQIFSAFSTDIISVNLMKGRMQGQAFVEFTDIEVAEKALDQCNGTIVKNKPIILQFGKRKNS